MKITSLIHNGVLFQEPFSSKGFDEIQGEKLSLLAQEMLWKFAPYAFNKKFNKNKQFLNNVWTDLKPQLPPKLQNWRFPNDFINLFSAIETVKTNLKVQKTEYNKTHKEEIEKQKIERKEKFGYCIKNKEKTEIANPYVESSRFFISRGDLIGRWVSYVEPEDVEINASEDIPCTVKNHHWKKIELKQSDYIATYKINVGFGTAYIDKYIWLSPNCKDKQKDNEHKFEKARNLSLKIDEIESTVLNDVTSTNPLKRENALITYIVLTFGIRIGNEHGKDNIRDKNVRGASTLCKENIVLEDDNKIHLEFIGKDSILFCETMEVDSVVYNEFIKQLENKKPLDKVYVYATSQSVNNYLKSIYDGEISPKLFRTVKSSNLLASEIQKRKWKNLTDKEFKNNLMECCLQTSLLLNHHKTVSDEQKEKLFESSEKKLANAKNTLDNIIIKTNKKLKVLRQEKKDFEFCLDGKLLEDKLAQIKSKENELKEKINLAKKKYNDIQNEVKFRKEAVDVNLGTALANYSEPKLPISLCKFADKSPSLIYSKSQLKKFEWTLDVSKDFWKKYPKV